MNSLTHSVSPLRQHMINDMRMRKFNGKAQIHYSRAVRRLAALLKRSPDSATAEYLRAFQLHMVETGKRLGGHHERSQEEDPPAAQRRAQAADPCLVRRARRFVGRRCHVALHQRQRRSQVAPRSGWRAACAPGSWLKTPARTLVESVSPECP